MVYIISLRNSSIPSTTIGRFRNIFDNKKIQGIRDLLASPNSAMIVMIKFKSVQHAVGILKPILKTQRWISDT